MGALVGLPKDAWAALPEVTLIEEVVLYADEQMATLGQAIANLQLPDWRREMFAAHVVVNDVKAGTKQPGPLGTTREQLALTPARRFARADLHLWHPLLDRFSRVDQVAFGVIDAGFLGEGRQAFRSLHAVRLRGAAEAEYLAVSGQVIIDWRRDGSRWVIERIETMQLDIEQSKAQWFADVLDRMVDGPTLARARRSIHEEMLARYLDDLSTPPTGFFKPESHDRHPALSVVDVDGDGADELYVMARFGKNMLLKRGPDGRWRDEAERWGIAVDGHSTAALFADFDNDGDPDLVVGRSQAPSLYFEHEGSGYRDRSEDIGLALPDRVASLAAADIDGDGWLDLHLATYAHQLPPERPYHPLSHAELGQLEQNAVIDAVGPANVLLRNEGAHRFSDATQTAGLLTHRHTFQATFGDVDDDGDPDLYLANDYAENSLWTNQGGRFVDSTATSGAADQGFGMAATFGDYDLDGHFDLYVANMFSKAGRRIMNKLPGLDPRFVKMAAGNSLFRNQGAGRYRRTSGDAEPHHPVAETGWSWGSLFTDVDGDGAEDLVVLNGYYTAPRALGRPVDS